MNHAPQKNPLAAIRLLKVSVNVGIPSSTKDPKFIDAVRDSLRRITGQLPVATLAKKSISSFKIRQGMVVGMKVTLRARRMRDFTTKLIHVVLPRTKDFWGLPKSHVDHQGNLTIGIKEHLAAPEIRSDEVEHLHGLEATLVSTAHTRGEALEFFKSLGVPFSND